MCIAQFNCIFCCEFIAGLIHLESLSYACTRIQIEIVLFDERLLYFEKLPHKLDYKKLPYKLDCKKLPYKPDYKATGYIGQAPVLEGNMFVLGYYSYIRQIP